MNAFAIVFASFLNFFSLSISLIAAKEIFNSRFILSRKRQLPKIPVCPTENCFGNMRGLKVFKDRQNLFCRTAVTNKTE